MSEKHKAQVRRFIDEVWNKGNTSALDEFLLPNYVHHDAATPDFGQGAAGEKQRVTLYRSAFPDLQFTIEDEVAEGDTVVIRWSSRGTHSGDLAGIAPTGKRVTVTGTSIVRFADDKMAEGWIHWDARSMFEQLGIVPETARAT